MELGWVPGGLVVHVTRGGGFRAGLESIAGPWPDGTEITLIFSPPNGDTPIEWAADVDGALALWQVSSGDVAEILDAEVDSVMLLRTTPGLDPDVWEKGYVHAH